jgi:pimeloyl-ACP methyl ester carboxylesterase
MTMLPIRDVTFHVEVFGNGYPLLLMHGGPGADLYTMVSFRQCADDFTLIFYDHRCNGRSEGAPVESMTWDNLTADADALRQEFGFERWAVLGHSFGGHVALEYALRYPDKLSHLILLDSGGDSWWSQVNASNLVAKRGYGEEKAELTRRWFNGEFQAREMMPIFLRIGGAYSHSTGIRGLIQLARDLAHGAWRSRMRAEPLIYAGSQLLKGWTVMDRLDEIAVPTLVMAGRGDFVFPPEHQAQLAAGIPGAELRIVEQAGHNAHSEQTEEVMSTIREFLTPDPALAAHS